MCVFLLQCVHGWLWVGPAMIRVPRSLRCCGTRDSDAGEEMQCPIHCFPVDQRRFVEGLRSIVVSRERCFYIISQHLQIVCTFLHVLHRNQFVLYMLHHFI